MSLIKFFKKAAPLADDVAGAVANYGDDALRLVSNYGDDAARLVVNSADDVAKATRTVDGFLPPPDVPNKRAQHRLKEKLANSRQSKLSGNNILEEPTMDFVGPGVHVYTPKEFNDIGWDEPYFVKEDYMSPYDDFYTVRTPDIPRSWVSKVNPGARYDSRNYDYLGDYLGTNKGNSTLYTAYEPMDPVLGYRPHRNTAFGKWYSDKLRELKALEASEPPEFTDLIDDFGVRTTAPPHYEPKVKKSDFATYNPLLEGSVNFPDGFASPDDFARYYDSLELGYAPSDFITDSLDDAFSGTVDADNWNDFWRAYHGTGPYADEGPLEAFFREQAKLPKGISKRQPLRTTEEFFSNPMFEDDWWL